jgi:hypothetical protein
VRDIFKAVAFPVFDSLVMYIKFHPWITVLHPFTDMFKPVRVLNLKTLSNELNVCVDIGILNQQHIS